MEYVEVQDRSVKHGMFTWSVINSVVCLVDEHFDTRSSIFSFAGFTWFLQLSVEDDGSNGIRVCVYLYRCEEDKDCRDIPIGFSATLKSAAGEIFAKTVGDYSFERGSVLRIISFDTTKQSFSDVLQNDNYEDALVVVCNVMYVGDYYKCSWTADRRYLCNDIMTLLSMDRIPGNAYLVTKCKNKVLVHKEILSVRSPVFEEQFKSGASYISVCLSRRVVEALLRFLYFGSISQVIDIGVSPSELCQLYEFAVKYEIFDLRMLLLPTKMTSNTVIKCEKYTVEACIGHFASVCVEPYQIVSFISENPQDKLTIAFNPKTCKFAFKLELSSRGRPEQRSVGILYIFWKDMLRSEVKRTRMGVPSFEKGDNTFYFSMEAENLFGKDYFVCPWNSLTIQFLIQFRLPGEISFSDPKFVDCGQELITNEHSLKLEQRMEYLLRSQSLADVRLIARSRENFPVHMRVHKSIISARSPVFCDLFQNGNISISSDLPLAVAKELVFYIYTGQLHKTRIGLFRLYEAAHEYKIIGLKKKCITLNRFLPLSHRNVLSKFHLADHARDIEFKNILKDFILKNKDLVLGTSRWQRFKTMYSDIAEEVLTLN